MTLSGMASSTGMESLHSKQLADDLFDGASEMLAAFRLLQQGRLTDYAALARESASRSTRIVEHCGALAVLDSVRAVPG